MGGRLSRALPVGRGGLGGRAGISMQVDVALSGGSGGSKQSRAALMLCARRGLQDADRGTANMVACFKLLLLQLY